MRGMRVQLSKRNKRISIASLVAGYCIALAFILLVFSNRAPVELAAQIEQEKLRAEENSTKTKIIYIDREVPVDQGGVIYHDKLTGIVVGEQSPAVVRKENMSVTNPRVDYLTNDKHIIIDESKRDFIAKNDLIYENHKTTTGTSARVINTDTVGDLRGGGLHRDDDRFGSDFVDNIRMDRADDILERRLQETEEQDIGIGVRNKEIDFSKLTVSNDSKDLDLDINLDQFKEKASGEPKSGELYAYSSPSLGIGAGVGGSSLGAGAGSSAGLSAGIGEAIMNGNAVPTLGGIGAPGKPVSANSDLDPMLSEPGMQSGVQQPPGASDGVGGLVSGSGAGAAAGLLVGKVYKNLGVGAGFVGERGKDYNYEHLPKDGGLHIMMHVDGSGSIINTRKQLETMKETILKDALLPYYNNSEELYNRRVTIVSTSGERTLKFFKEATKKENVLAIAFQDEAQPAYHLPNFNKKPEDHYMDDLKSLKSSLNGYEGTYRGVMFQVDRGKTFAKSFKEFVGNSFKGEGYLESENLKKYHRDSNLNHIKNKDGIIFSDEYHAKDSGDPKYYLDLIFKAAKRVGLNLNTHAAGLTDGGYNPQK